MDQGMLWKIKKACEGEKGQLGLLWHLEVGALFSNPSAGGLPVTCSQLGLDVFAPLSFCGLSNHSPGKAWKQSIKAQKYTFMALCLTLWF